MKTYTVQPKQTLLDAVMQATGSLEGVMAVAVANNISVSDDVAVGTELLIPDTLTGLAMTNKTVVDYLTGNGYVVGNKGVFVMPLLVEEGGALEGEGGGVLLPE